MIEFGRLAEHGMGASSYASGIHPIWARPTPFLPFHLCAPLHACCRLSTSANLEILGLVPSNPKHNTSLETFRLLRGGNKAETCCTIVSASLPLCCCLTSFSELSKQQYSNIAHLSYVLSSLTSPFALPEQTNSLSGGKVDTCFHSVSALALFHSRSHSSSKGEETEIGGKLVENHTWAAAPPEKEKADQNFLLVREAYEKAIGNRWNQSDSEAYEQNKIVNVPAAKTVSVLDAVVRRTPTKINSFKYFVKEITAQPDSRNRAWQKKRLEKIVHKIRDISVGRGNYSMADFVEDVKCNCAREGIVFENDLFNELVS